MVAPLVGRRHTRRHDLNVGVIAHNDVVPLPEHANQPWPPKQWTPFAEDIAGWDRWYSGAGHHTKPDPGTNTIWQSFTSKIIGGRPKTAGVNEQRIHIPAAADIAATGADLLFGETPSFTIPEAHGNTPDSTATATEERLNDLLDLDGWASTIIEGAEIAGALGGVFLRPLVDLDVVDHPILTVVHPDVAVPEYRHGRLVAVTFWRSWCDDGQHVWRHLERHDRGRIEHALYVGTTETIGERRHLAQRSETLGFATDDTDIYGGGVVDLDAMGIDRLLPAYVPNALPNRHHRTEPVGRADYDGTEPLLAALDETWTSWVRDIRLARARLIVPDEYLDHKGRGQGATFDMDREIFSPLEIDPNQAGANAITLVQFQIRTDDHERTTRALFEQAIRSSGYSPQSFGLKGDGATITATEVDANEGKSAATIDRKQQHWRRALSHAAESMLWLDNKLCGTSVTPMRPSVIYPDSAESDMRETASTLNLIKLAGAASTETLVRTLNPTWTDVQVDAEVERIIEDRRTPVDDPTGFLT